jgi:hypothetical protein
VVETDQPAAAVDRHPDRIEPDLRAARAPCRLAEEGRGETTHAAALALVERVPRRSGTLRAARLDLHEDQAPGAVDDQVDLAEPGPVVAGDKAIAEALQVLERQSLAGPSEDVAGIWPGSGHAAKLRVTRCHDSTLPVTGLRRNVAATATSDTGSSRFAKERAAGHGFVTDSGRALT